MQLTELDAAALVGLWGRRCAYCGSAVREGTATQMAFDHLLPASRGGGDELPNLAYACKSCNSRKGAKTAEEFGRADVAVRAAEIANLVREWVGGRGSCEIWTRYTEELIRMVQVSPFCRAFAGVLPLVRPWYQFGRLMWPHEEWRARAFERMMLASRE